MTPFLFVLFTAFGGLLFGNIIFKKKYSNSYLYAWAWLNKEEGGGGERERWAYENISLLVAYKRE